MAKQGRPSKYTNIDLEQVEKLCMKGWTDKEMSDFFSVSEVTWNKYKKEHEEFLKSLKIGKEEADRKVEMSLFERANGHSHPDVHISNYQGVVTTTDIVKHYPPDTGACIFWLKNRKKAEWKDRFDNYEHKDDEIPDIDNMTDEEVEAYLEKFKNSRKA